MAHDHPLAWRQETVC